MPLATPRHSLWSFRKRWRAGDKIQFWWRKVDDDREIRWDGPPTMCVHGSAQAVALRRRNTSSKHMQRVKWLMLTHCLRISRVLCVRHNVTKISKYTVYTHTHTNARARQSLLLIDAFNAISRNFICLWGCSIWGRTNEWPKATSGRRNFVCGIFALKWCVLVQK